MNFSDKAIDLIKHFEGCECTAYQDCAGVWTIGFGCTAGVIPGMTITQDQAETMLRDALKPVSDAICRLVVVDILQNHFDALTSFTYNLGSGALQSSTLLRLVNQRDFDGAAQEFPKWCHAGGKVQPGLVARRAAERALFLGSDQVQPTQSASA